MREKRWLLCFLVAMCCTFSAWALPSQDKTVTLKLHNVSIETVLDAVKKQTCPKHPGDWYFSGDYPTPGGVKMLNKAFIDYIEQVYQF